MTLKKRAKAKAAAKVWAPKVNAVGQAARPELKMVQSGRSRIGYPLPLVTGRRKSSFGLVRKLDGAQRSGFSAERNAIQYIQSWHFKVRSAFRSDQFSGPIRKTFSRSRPSHACETSLVNFLIQHAYLQLSDRYMTDDDVDWLRLC
jgi:hypothetical protein